MTPTFLGGGVTLKALSLAAFVGLAFGALPVMAAHESKYVVGEEEITSFDNKTISNETIEWGADDFEPGNTTVNLPGVVIENKGTITSINNTVFEKNIKSINIIRDKRDNNSFSITDGVLIQNSGKIDSISNTIFKNNTLELNTYNTGQVFLYGGLINNSGSIAKMDNVEFANNSVSLYTRADDGNPGGFVYGGYIQNTNKIGSISGYFHDNIFNRDTQSSYAKIYGGMIYNTANATIDTINVIFENNTVKAHTETASWSHTSGAIICNATDGEIKEIRGSYLGNNSSLISDDGAQLEGLIANNGTIGKIIDVDFINNTSYAEAGMNNSYGTVRGGAIHNSGGHIGLLSGKFINNKITASTTENAEVTYISAMGGAVMNRHGGIIDVLSGYFEKNHAKVISDVDKELYAKGGAIAKWQDNGIGAIKNSIFIDNIAEVVASTENIKAQGGAIYSDTNLNIIADNGVSEFRDNKTILNGETDDNAIYLDNADGVLDFQLKNNGSIVMKDNIRGAYTEAVLDDEGNVTEDAKHYTVNIKGDNKDKTTFYMHNDIYDANVTLGNTTINTINNEAHTYNFHSLTLTGDVNMAVDVDLKKGEMDRFTANEYGEHQGTLHVVGMNLLSDAKEDSTKILFAQKGLKDKVENGTGELPDKKYQTAYTPIYKYKVDYLKTDEEGYFVFSRGAAGSSDRYNPSVLAAPVTTQAAGQSTMVEVFRNAFVHSDSFSKLPESTRQAKINANRYALSTDYNNNLGSLCLDHETNHSAWFKPYVTFESVNLSNGPKVDAITYGSLAGFDGDFHQHKNGWASVTTGYVGYFGSQLSYGGVDTTLNGGLLGVTETFYKGNFWTALTASAGAGVADTRTMYGKEDSTMLMAGVASKSGYNFEFKEGKYILQPIVQMAYTMVNTFDYTNAAGVRIDSDPMHTIQLNPSVRFITNAKNGWQPYAQVGMVWNLMNDSHTTANNELLPNIHTKPYIEYGLGVQRNWGDKFSAYGQAMVRNGGRNGIALTAGLRWALGRDTAHSHDKVQAKPTGKIVKQLDYNQKTVLKNQSTTRTANQANIKKL